MIPIQIHRNCDPITNRSAMNCTWRRISDKNNFLYDFNRSPVPSEYIRTFTIHLISICLQFQIFPKETSTFIDRFIFSLLLPISTASSKFYSCSRLDYFLVLHRWLKTFQRFPLIFSSIVTHFMLRNNFLEQSSFKRWINVSATNWFFVMSTMILGLCEYVSLGKFLVEDVSFRFDLIDRRYSRVFEFFDVLVLRHWTRGVFRNRSAIRIYSNYHWSHEIGTGVFWGWSNIIRRCHCLFTYAVWVFVTGGWKIKRK